MKIKDGYKVREIAGEHIIVNQGIAGVDFTKIISLNGTARFLFETFTDREFTIENVAETLTEKYGICQELAITDAEKWIDGMSKAAILE